MEVTARAGAQRPMAGASWPEFAAWLETNWATMTAVAWRMSRTGDAEDVLQEVSLAPWRNRAQFDPGRGSARAWLLTITVNQARKSHRGVRLDHGRHRDFVEDCADVRIDLARAMSTLSRRQKLAVDLHYYAGLTVVETSVVMRCAEGTVKSTLAQARRRLRSALEGDYS